MWASIKKPFYKRYFRKQIKRHPATLSNDPSNTYTTELSEYDKWGVEPNADEELAEGAKELANSKNFDRIFFYGTDTLNNVFVLRVTRRKDRVAEVILLLRLPDGREYHLPGAPDTTVYNTNGNTFDALGLKLQVLEPFRRWRICFSGQLRESNGDYHQHHSNEPPTVAVNFHFLWTALKGPFEWRRDASPNLTAENAVHDMSSARAWDKIRSSQLHGYGQFGVLSGRLEIQDVEEGQVDWYLRGIRQHFWGEKSDHSEFHSYGYTDNGLLYHVGVRSDIEGLPLYKVGTVHDPADDVLFVDKCAFSVVTSTLLLVKQTPKEINMKVKADKRKYSIKTREKGVTTFYEDRPWNVEIKIQFLELMLNDEHKGYGIAMYINPWSGECPEPTNLSLPLVAEPVLNLTQKPLSVKFSDIRCQSSAVVGGKGSSLAILTSIQHKKEKECGFVVPVGICLTTEAFAMQKRVNTDLRQAISEVVSASALRQQMSTIEATCDRAVKVIGATVVCPAVVESLLEALPPDYNMKRFAVRSSAVGEDSYELSAAGQNETFLAVGSFNEILKAVAKCWASVFAYRSVAYRRQYGQPIDAEIGVVIQEMVYADAAGVLFTRDPVTGSMNNLIITANYGLGESVVSGSIDPDSFTLFRSSGNKIIIKEKHCGAKASKVVSSSDKDGVTINDVGMRERCELCISDDIAIRLGEIGVLLENMFGEPKDIEWAVVKDTLYLLQARQISSYHPWSEHELTHELDIPVLTSSECFTKANTGEVFPDATRPLSLTTVVKWLDVGCQMYIIEENVGRVVRRFQPHCYLNIGIFCHQTFIDVISILLRKNATADFDAPVKAANIAIFGHLVFTPELIDVAVGRYGLLRKTDAIKLLRNLREDYRKCPKFVKAATDTVREFRIDYKKIDDPQDLFEEICQSSPVYMKLSATHVRVSFVSMTTQIILITMLSKDREWDAELYGDLSKLLSTCEKVVSAQVPQYMSEIATLLAEDGDDEEFIAIEDPDTAAAYLQNRKSKAGEKYREFISEFGHHGPKEFDLGEPSWRMNANEPIMTIKSILKMKITNGNKKPEKPIGEEYLSRLSRFQRYKFRKLLQFCHTAVANREDIKSAMILCVEQFRQAYTHLAEMMVQKGWLPDKDMLFYFTLWELRKYLRTRSASYVQKAAARRRLFPKWNDITFPELCFGVPSPVASKTEETKYESVMKLKATPASCGVVQGAARVITDLKHANQIKPGDILITYGTNIAWTPYFAVIGGIATELGGTVSHGTVVARDHGIPCVVGATGATKIFQSGDLIILDGTAGTIEKISSHSSEDVTKLPEEDQKGLQDKNLKMLINEKSKYCAAKQCCLQPLEI